MQRTSQTKKHIEQHKKNRTTQKVHRTTQKLGRVRVVTRLCGFYHGICLTTEEKALEKPQSG
jgi:hypothetical protein